MRVATLLSVSPTFTTLGLNSWALIDPATKTVGGVSHCSGVRVALSEGLIRGYHRFMIVTANNEDETRRWIFWQPTDVLVAKLVGQTHPLRLMLYGLPIHNCMLELLHDSFVNSIALTSGKQRPTDKIESPTKSSTVQAVFLSTTGVL